MCNNLSILCALCVIVCYLYVQFMNANIMISHRKRAAILERYAMDPKTASFSSATSLGSASLEGNHKRTVQLREFIYNTLVPARFNGTWISDSEIIFNDQHGGIKVLNVETNAAYQVLRIRTILIVSYLR